MGLQVHIARHRRRGGARGSGRVCGGACEERREGQPAPHLAPAADRCRGHPALRRARRHRKFPGVLGVARTITSRSSTCRRSGPERVNRMYPIASDAAQRRTHRRRQRLVGVDGRSARGDGGGDNASGSRTTSRTDVLNENERVDLADDDRGLHHRGRVADAPRGARPGLSKPARLPISSCSTGTSSRFRPPSLDAVRVDLTMLDGKPVYERSDAPLTGAHSTTASTVTRP